MTESIHFKAYFQQLPVSYELIIVDVAESTAVSGHQGIGSAEKHHDIIAGYARTYANQVYRNTGLRIMPATRLFAWLIRYCSFIVTNYHLRVSGQTSHFMLKGTDVQYKLCYFAETVMWKWQDTDKPRSKVLPRWQKGIWAGISEPSGQHVVLTKDGAEMTRNVCRLPIEDQWDAKLLTAVAGTP